MPDQHYDIIVIGTGPGGASLAQRLAPTGKRILMIERGDYLKRGIENWDAGTVNEIWHDKVYAALFRVRTRDFEAVPHADGMSPAWPLSYADVEPYYTQAERLFRVHGLRGEDPTEQQSMDGAAPQWNDTLVPRQATVVFSVMPRGWVGEWHENPHPQWIVPLSGRGFVESMDGARVEMGPGEVSFGGDQHCVADAGGRKGHRSGVLGDESAVLMLVQLEHPGARGRPANATEDVHG